MRCWHATWKFARAARCGLVANLQDDPDVDDQVAADEQGRLPVQVARLVDEGHPINPCLASRDEEHGDEGQVELAEGARHQLLEERHPEYGVWQGGGVRTADALVLARWVQANITGRYGLVALQVQFFGT
jgi:hypothetical protein